MRCCCFALACAVCLLGAGGCPDIIYKPPAIGHVDAEDDTRFVTEKDELLVMGDTLARVALDGSTREVLIPARASLEDVSPDGRWFAFSGARKLWLLGGTRSIHALDLAVRHAEFAPIGVALVALAANGGLYYLRDPEATEASPLVSPQNTHPGHIESIFWRGPDGPIVALESAQAMEGSPIMDYELEIGVPDGTILQQRRIPTGGGEFGPGDGGRMRFADLGRCVTGNAADCPCAAALHIVSAGPEKLVLTNEQGQSEIVASVVPRKQGNAEHGPAPYVEDVAFSRSCRFVVFTYARETFVTDRQTHRTGHLATGHLLSWPRGP